MRANHVSTWYKNVQASQMIASRQPSGCRGVGWGSRRGALAKSSPLAFSLMSVTNKNPLQLQGKRAWGKLSTISAQIYVYMRKIRSQPAIQLPRIRETRASCHPPVDPVACCPQKNSHPAVVSCPTHHGFSTGDSPAKVLTNDHRFCMLPVRHVV